MSFWSSASLIGWSGRLRSWLWVVVKPFTSSPAMPMTTWLGRKPAISSASWSATAQLSTTAAMSATVPDCMCDRPWRLRPTPRTVPWPSSPISKTRALANSVPMSSAVQAASASPLSRCRIRRQKAISLPRSSRRSNRRRSASGQPVAPACPCPAPSPAGRRPGRRSRRPPPSTRSPADTPRSTRSSLTVTKTCGSSASRPSAITPDANAAADVLRDALQRVDRLERPGERDEPDARARPPRRAPRARPASGAPAAAAGLRRRFVSRSSSWSARDPLRDAPRPSARRRPPRPRRASRRARRCSASAPAPVTASMRRMPEPMLRSPVITKPPIWPRRAAVRPAAQLVAVALDPHGPDASRRTSRRRTRRRRRRSPRPSSCSSTSPGGPRGRRAGPRPRSRASPRRSARGRTGSRSAGPPASTSEPAWRARSPTTLRSARWSRCVPVWLRIVCARRSASTSALTVSPTRSRPWSVPRWTMRPPTGFWVSSTANSAAPPPASRISPWSPTWPPPSA